jgi:hypothetical protein
MSPWQAFTALKGLTGTNTPAYFSSKTFKTFSSSPKLQIDRVSILNPPLSLHQTLKVNKLDCFLMPSLFSPVLYL